MNQISDKNTPAQDTNYVKSPDVTQQGITKHPANINTNSKGLDKAKLLTLQRILKLVAEGKDTGDICKAMSWNRYKLYRFLNQDFCQKVLNQAESQAILMTGKSLTAVNRALELQDHTDPDIQIKAGNLGVNFLSKIIFREEKDRVGEKTLDVIKVIVETFGQLKTQKVVEADYEVMDNTPTVSEADKPAKEPVKPDIAS